NTIFYVGRGDPTLDAHWKVLEDKGWRVTLTSSQKRAVARAGPEQPAIIIVDATATRLSPERLCHLLRQRSPASALLLFIAAGARLPDAPCDSVLVKPFTQRKLSIRLQSLLKERTNRTLQVGPLILDLSTRRLHSDKGEHTLTPKEFDLLLLFMQNAGRVLSRRVIMEEVWHTSYLGYTRTLDVHIRWLRQKIEAEPSHPTILRTRRGVGYVLGNESSPGSYPRPESNNSKTAA
ncbi:MAG: response regulator transcription factor, partial [Anaerolineae bacterium]|nr:response regulator transcription factor [Anaerolineae bacterium]